MELGLAALPASVFGAGSPGPKVETPPAAVPEKAAANPPSSLREAAASIAIQPPKKERAARQNRERALTETGKIDLESDRQPAGDGQAFPAARPGDKQGGSGGGTLPVPFGTQVNPRPAYPELARQRGQEGQVVVLVNVDIHGNPTSVLLETSSGYSLLDQASITAIRKWKFSPASRNGEAVPGAVRVPVFFRLQ